jgi:hypothetical protein
MCLLMHPLGMVWWTPGWIPKGVHPGLPLHNPRMTYICTCTYKLHTDGQMWTRYTSLFVELDTYVLTNCFLQQAILQEHIHIK